MSSINNWYGGVNSHHTLRFQIQKNNIHLNNKAHNILLVPAKQIDYTKGHSTQIYKFETEIEYTHNLKELYKRLHYYLEERGFKDQNGTDFYEVMYWQRDLPGGLQEHQMWWRAYKYAGQGHAPHKFFTYFFKLNYQTIAVKKTEVMHKGKKWKLHESNTILRCTAFLIENYDSDWESGLLKSFKNKYQQWIYKDKKKLHIGNLYNEARAFQNAIRAFLELVQVSESKADIYPPNMLP